MLEAKKEELEERGEIGVANKLADLALKIKNNMEHLKQMPPEVYNQNVLGVIQQCQREILYNKDSFQENRSINCILANTALAIAGLGLIYLAAASIKKMVTGRFLFFAETKTEALIGQVKNELTKLQDDEKLSVRPSS